MRHALIVSAVTAAAALFVAAPAAHAYLYVAHDLGTLPGGTSSQATGVNANGQVVGYSTTATGATHAFVYDPITQVMTDLGTLPGGTDSRAQGINDSGQIVGYSTVSGKNRAFLYNPGGSPTDLGTLPGGTAAIAYAINNAGQIVGNSDFTGTSVPQAFRYTPGSGFTPLGGASGNGYAVNATGQTAGASAEGGFLHGTIFNPPAPNKGIPYLGSTGTPNGSAFGNNDAGLVVGYDSGNGGAGQGPLFAFLFDPATDTLTNLSPANSGARALDINNNNQVVGTIGSTPRAYIFDIPTTTPTNLNTLIAPGSGLTLLSATAINDAGWIVGYGTTATGETHAYLLTVPEPASLGLVALPALVAFRRRRRA